MKKDFRDQNLPQNADSTANMDVYNGLCSKYIQALLQLVDSE